MPTNFNESTEVNFCRMYTLYELNELIQNAEGSNIFFELTD